VAVREAVERLTDAGLTRGAAVYLGAPRQGTTARRSDPRYATAEARVLDRAQRGQGAGYGLASVVAAVRHAELAGLDSDQRAAVIAATTPATPSP
jgi:hypothetical protein